MQRRAIIRATRAGLPRVDVVQAYLPANYSAKQERGAIWITGHDSAGWTLDGYVIPRLASALIFAKELS